MSETEHQEAKKLAEMFAPSDANYIFVCPNCRSSGWKQQDCQTTRDVRNGDATCADCGHKIIMAADKQ